MQYPNQRKIIIRKHEEYNDLTEPSCTINIPTIKYAMSILTPTGFLAWILLLINKNGYELDYSPAYIEKYAPICKCTARKALKELAEKQYLVPANELQTIFYFYDYPSGMLHPTGKISSTGEKNIYSLLSKHCIKFYFDYPYFKDLYSDKHNLLRYDFILINDENKPYRIIEMDSPYHTTDLNIQHNDITKSEYAKTHNIPLVRIPYKERDNITLEMLMGDKYLIA